LNRIILAIKSFFSILFSGKLSDEAAFDLGLMRRAATPAPKPKPAAEQPAAADGAVQMLALLQQEARLVDFLQEDIAGYSDEQVGAAVRGIHEQSRKALDRHVKLAPIVDGVEGTTTRLASAGLDPNDKSTLKLVGQVPPDGKVEAGILRHRGWKAEKVELPSAKAGRRVIAPAEVEVE